uniref:Ig-like domain-containing protein n=1 Tax=Oncorhynchus kisutch TaxID=8019 RepID=A0A8C7MY62_ONCKI
ISRPLRFCDSSIDLVSHIVVTFYSQLLTFVRSLSDLTRVVCVSPPPLMVVHSGENVTLQCINVLKKPGHVGWFKQVNGSEPLCITSMWSSVPTVHHQNGFQGRSMKMFMTNITIFLTITEVEVADSGLYFCGMSDTYFIFANATVLKVQDGTMNLFLLVVILGVVTAVLLIIILILVLENQDPDALNYAALNFTSKKKERRGEKELDPHVVYAATR